MVTEHPSIHLSSPTALIILASLQMPVVGS